MESAILNLLYEEKQILSNELIDAQPDPDYKNIQGFWIANKIGKILSIDLSNKKSTIILDLTGNLESKYLLGLVIHPEYEKNKRFYVKYSEKNEHACNIVIAEFTKRETSNETLKTENRLITIPNTFDQIIVSSMIFDSNNNLYVAFPSNYDSILKETDCFLLGNDKKSLNGTIIKINIEELKKIGIINANKNENLEAWPDLNEKPIIDMEKRIKYLIEKNIVVYGLKNPFKFTIDSNKKLYITDVISNIFQKIFTIDLSNDKEQYFSGFSIDNEKMPNTLIYVSTNLPKLNILPIDKFIIQNTKDDVLIGGCTYKNNSYIYGLRNGTIMLFNNDLDYNENELPGTKLGTFNDKTINSFFKDSEENIYMTCNTLDSFQIYKIELNNKENSNSSLQSNKLDNSFESFHLSDDDDDEITILEKNNMIDLTNVNYTTSEEFPKIFGKLKFNNNEHRNFVNDGKIDLIEKYDEILSLNEIDKLFKCVDDLEMNNNSDFRRDINYKPLFPKLHKYILNADGQLYWKYTKDAWLISKEIAKSKAIVAFGFSSNENSLLSSDISKLIKPNEKLYGISPFIYSGIQLVFQAGGVPIYKNNKKVGSLGISGDSVTIEDKISKLAIEKAGFYLFPIRNL